MNGWQLQLPDVRVRRRLVCDVPVRWLVKGAKDAQLVVVGSDGRRRVDRNAFGLGEFGGRPVRGCSSGHRS